MMGRRAFAGLIIVAFAASVAASWLHADAGDPNSTSVGGVKATKSETAKTDSGNPASSAAAKNGKGGKRLTGFTEEREAAALTFVRANHPELAALLEQLKLSDNAEYQRAVRELFHSSEKLAQLQERNPKRYPIELEAWKLNSRIQLLVARLSMNPDPKIEDQLRQALVEQMQLRRAQLTEERERLEARLTELKSQFDELDRQQGQYVEQKLAKLLGDARKSHSELKAARSTGNRKKKADEAGTSETSPAKQSSNKEQSNKE